MQPHANGRRAQRGAAAIGITVLLFFAMLIALAALDRNLIFEHRASVNQYQATQAFEAAEAGLEWALARLDDGRGIGADCTPSNAAALSFRGQRLLWNAATLAITPVTRPEGGAPVPLEAACVRVAEGWQCDCPTAARPALAAPAIGPAPAFVMHFEPSPRAGVVRAIAVGCTSFAGACAGGVGHVDATARVEATLAVLPGLRTQPAAPLTVRGTVDADAAPFGAHNAEPGAAVAIHAGGAVRAAQARLEGPAGAAGTDLVAANDVALAALAPERLFTAIFGLDPRAWSERADVHRLACPLVGDCGAALSALLANERGAVLVRIDGDLALDGPLDLGSADRPVIVSASGSVHLRGAVRLAGVLHGGDVEWSSAGADLGFVRGALIVAGDYRGDGAPELVYDAAVLTRLRTWSGGFVRVPGTWKDF